MKKFIALLVLMLASVSLFSCDKTNTDDNGGNEQNSGGEVNTGGEENPDNGGASTNGDGDNSGNTELTEEDKLFFENVETYVRSFIKSPVKGNLKLKSSYYSTGATMSYVSSKPEFVTNDGKYINHEYDEKVTLTCTVEWQGKTHTFDIEFISTGIDDKEKLVKVKNWVQEFLDNTELTEGTQLPTTHPQYGGRIRWVCESAGVVVDYKTINLPTEKGTYRLLAEYTFASPSAYEIVPYPVELEATTLTTEERVKNFIKQSLIPTEGYFINLYEGSAPKINTSWLIDIEDENIVSHLHSGYKPTVSQEFLDEEIYEGYELKNEEQVVWIVVHESGMNTTGVNAEYLAKAQYNYAYNGASRDASWNYQVDDGEIYQSYGDNVYCWHASSRRGNSNSIGIEMCVNPDGEFNASMRNDARLIAYFLHKYNLGMLNVKQHFNFDANGKNCPENIRNDRRWFELLGMITREYASQDLLEDVEVTYNIVSGNTEEWKLPGIYKLTNNSEVIVEVTVYGETFTISTVNE